MSAAPKGTNVQFRREWNKEEYAEKAKKKDEDEKERMKDNEERLKQGKKPRKARKEELVKPTELMQRRATSLELEKNLNKTLVVQQTSGRGPGVPGFFCATCERTYKDSAGYLDHVNSRAHLARLGQTTKIERSTVEQVRARIAALRAQTAARTSAKTFDFEQRLADVRAREAAVRAEKKAGAKARKERARLALLQDVDMGAADDMAAAMGFSGFGSSKK